MITKILSLANIFYNSTNFFIKNSSEYDQFKAKIEELSKKNKKPFNKWFDGKDRIYLDYSSNVELSDDDLEIITVLEIKGYTVDYFGGYAEKDNRKIKISKVLESLKTKEPQTKEPNSYIYYDKLKNNFINSKARIGAKKQLKIVISQNPHDIAKMSTDRGWSSCMNLVSGANKDSVYCEVSSGGLIAYLIEADDLEINHPLARVLIRRFSNSSGKSYAILEDQVYGSAPEDFTKKIQAWLDERQGFTKGIYKLRGGWYTDSLQEEIMPNPKSFQEEAVKFINQNKKLPKILLEKILNNKEEFSSDVIQAAKKQIFSDVRTIENFLSGHPFKIKNYEMLLNDYFQNNPSKIDEFVENASNVNIIYLINTLKFVDTFNDKPKISNIIKEKFEKKLNDKINDNLSSSNNESEKRLSDWELLHLLNDKINIATAQNLLKTAEEVLLYAEKHLNSEHLYRLVKICISRFLSLDVINQNVISSMKPYINFIFEKDLENAFEHCQPFLARSGNLVSFLLPKLEELLNKTKKINKSEISLYPQGSLERAQLEAIIEGIKKNEVTKLFRNSLILK